MSCRRLRLSRRIKLERQPLNVLVSKMLVDFRTVSSISAWSMELEMICKISIFHARLSPSLTKVEYKVHSQQEGIYLIHL
jgi:hypothetical protein